MSTPESRMAKMPNKQGAVKLPKPTNVPSLATIMPAFFSPMKAMNMPIPDDMA